MRKVTLKEIRQLALKAKPSLWALANSLNRDVKLYLHWTAGSYTAYFDDYHINISGSGQYFISTEDFSEILAHTYRRNSGSIGISLACALNATTEDLGCYPPTKEQIEAISRVIAVLSKALDLTVDLKRVMTHGEAANNEDGITTLHEPYGPFSGDPETRWDLAILDNSMKFGKGGYELRGKAAWYLKTYPDGVEKHFD